MRPLIWTGPLAALAALSGCAATRPSQQLVDARTLVAQASTGRAAKYAPQDLLLAKELLAKAENRDDGSSEEIHYAYLADRAARRANARGSSLYFAEQEKTAISAYNELQETGRLNAQERLAESEKARGEAEARAAAAMASLKELGSLRDDPRETVLTLSGSVLFKTGEATLLPVAQDSLARVAEALRALPEERSIVVEGHTDSQGDDDANQRLSQARAEAVLAFLSSHGVAAGRLSAVGHGESKPIASNATAEGRANNRRVELIIQKGSPDRHAGR